MTTVSDVHAEVEKFRKELLDAKNTALEKEESHKRQLSDAKTRAKAVIQRKINEASARLELINERNAQQADELSKLKQILRDADENACRLSEENKRIGEQLHGAKHAAHRLRDHCTSLERGQKEMKSSLEGKLNASEEEVARVKVQLSAATSDLASMKETLENLQTNTDSSSSAPQPASDEEIKAAKLEISELRIKCGELQEENTKLQNRERTTTASSNDLSESPTKVSALWEELTQAKDQAESLSADLAQAEEKANTKKSEHEKILKNLEDQRLSAEDKLKSLEESCSSLREDLAKSERALQDERQKNVEEQKKKPSAATFTDEKTKILEAKVAEMERVVASKQSEIGRVREKARTYLRELNAEKRDMEEKMKEEVEDLKKELLDQQGKIEEADQRAEGTTADLDNCLALIREKQKSVQMLKMSLSTQTSAVREAENKTAVMHAEFMRYKERARLALQEKETASEEIEDTIQNATVSLRDELQSVKEHNMALKEQLKKVRSLQAMYDDTVERAERAEAAVDLLRKNVGGSAMNYTQVDILQEKVATIQSELSSAHLATEDAESSHETTKMRLEAAERALRGAEMRAEEVERVSTKQLHGLRKQVDCLETDLRRAQATSAAAQRTAAAAAKALVLDSSDDKAETSSNTDMFSPRKSNGMMGEVSSPFASPDGNGPRSTLALAMVGHSDSLGLGSSFGSPRIADREMEVKMRDQQIAVLTTQMEEMGSLLNEVQGESELRSEQTALLKEEVKNLDAKLAAAEKLQNGAPFSYLRTIVVRYLETDDATLLPVIANVLSFTEEENSRVKEGRGGGRTAVASPKAGYFGFLGTR